MKSLYCSRVRAIKYINEQVHQGLWGESHDNWSYVQESLARTVLAEGYTDDQKIRTLIGEDIISVVTNSYNFGEDSDLNKWKGMGAW